MPTPTNSLLPAPTSVTQGTITVKTGSNPTASEAELYNLSYFMAAMQTALANSSTFAAFQSAMAALPATP
jgi:hypothetical protein